MKKEIIMINSFLPNPSLVDGPGYRTVLFLQGCDFKCCGCHNPSSRDLTKGKAFLIDDLVSEIKKKCFNKKITISGGEPLLQEEALILLLEKISDFDICLYTGKNYEDVPPKVMKYIKYLKFGRYEQDLRTTTIPYIGSSNQTFVEVKKNNEKTK